MGPERTAWTALKPETELLLRCVRQFAGRDEKERIAALLRCGLDWGRLPRMAEDHKVLPILYAELKASFSDRVPEASLNEMKLRHAASFARNLLLSYELLRMLEAFQTAGIRCLAFKGPTLAVIAYGGITMRQFQDLDLLVSRQDFPKTMKVLAELGYEPALSLPAASREYYFLTRSEHHFIRRDGKATADMHWGLSPPGFSFFQDLDRLWPGSMPVTVEGGEVRSPGNEDLLLYLCRHGAKHHWEALYQICDVARLIAVHPAMDWTGILSRARRTNSSVMLAMGLKLASDLLGAVLPEHIADWTRADRQAAVLAGEVIDVLLRRDVGPAGGFSQRLNLFHIGAMSSFSDKLREIVLNLFTPTAIELSLVNLPRRLYFLYYPLRLLRLAARHIGKRGDRI